MAEENRDTRQGEWEGNGRGSAAAEPSTAEEARHAIEQTRGRISATLDAIEDRLDAKKEQLKQRTDVLRPVRRQVRMHLWPSLGIAFGTGLLISGLGGRKVARDRWPGEAERRERRRWRAERRARMRLHTPEPDRAASRQRANDREPSPFDDFARAIARAVADGLKQRVASQ